MTCFSVIRVSLPKPFLFSRQKNNKETWCHKTISLITIYGRSATFFGRFITFKFSWKLWENIQKCWRGLKTFSFQVKNTNYLENHLIAFNFSKQRRFSFFYIGFSVKLTFNVEHACSSHLNHFISWLSRGLLPLGYLIFDEMRRNWEFTLHAMYSYF